MSKLLNNQREYIPIMFLRYVVSIAPLQYIIVTIYYTRHRLYSHYDIPIIVSVISHA